MEPTEKDIVIEKVKDMPPEQVAKVLIFIAGLKSGSDFKAENEQSTNKIIRRGRNERKT